MRNSIIIKSTTVKNLVLYIAFINATVLTLTGCQNTQTLSANQATTTNTLFTQDLQLFNNIDNPSAAHSAKNYFISALQRHLNREHTSVSQMRYKVTPYIGTDDIEAKHTSLFHTFMQLRNYQDETYGYADAGYYGDPYNDYGFNGQNDEPAYRTEKEYLKGNEDKLYLRYDDEVNGTTPSADYNITRKTGMSESYRDLNSSLYYYAYNHDDCVIDYSYDLDTLVEDDPYITSDNKRITALKQTYNDCVSEVKLEYQADIDAAIGYQTSYATTQDNCAALYHNNMDTMLSDSRHSLSLSYDHYDSVYQSYRVCYELVGDRWDIEPEQYTYYETSEKSLNFSKAKLECAQQLFDKQAQLVNSGESLAVSPKKHADLFYNDYSICVFDAEQAILYNDIEPGADEYRDYDHSKEDATNVMPVDYATPDEANNDYDDYDDDYEDYDDLEAMVAAYDVEEDYDLESYDDEDYYHEDYYHEEHDSQDYDSGEEKFKSDLMNLNIAGFLQDYRDMKRKQALAAQESDNADTSEDENYNDPYGSSMGAVSKFFDLIQKSPEQLQALNYYGYEPLTINSVSRYNPAQQRYTAVYSYDFASPTFKASVQMPIEFDFKQAQITMDPSAVLPLMAIIDPEDTPLADDLSGRVVTFSLPAGMENIPTGVLQRSFLSAIQKGLDGLDAEYFTEVSIDNDIFAQQLGATRGIKIYLGSKQSGVLIGEIIKHLTKDLNDYVDAHPQDFPQDHPLREILDNWTLYNQGFQAKDIGSILQLIEAIAPISFDRFSYFYFNEQGEMIARQSRTDFSSYLSQTNYIIVQQTRFDNQAFKLSPYANQLDTLFISNRDSIDANAWIKQLKEQNALLEKGRYARYGYDLPSFEDEYDEIYGYDYAEEIKDDVDGDGDGDGDGDIDIDVPNDPKQAPSNYSDGLYIDDAAKRPELSQKSLLDTVFIKTTQVIMPAQDQPGAIAIDTTNSIETIELIKPKNAD